MKTHPLDAITCCAALAAFAQTAAKLPSFEVASVKASKARTAPRAVPKCQSGTYTMSNLSVANTVSYAFNVLPFEVKGYPDWSRTAAFDIEGKAGKPVDEATCRQMVQSLLADRFQLAYHRESRQTSVYALVVGKDGIKAKEADPASTVNQVKVNGAPGYDGERGWTMAQVADFLGRGFPGTPVIDRTGLTGHYAFEFDFTIEPGTPPGDAMAAAIEHKLGLKLETRKEPLDYIVIDRLEKPTEN